MFYDIIQTVIADIWKKKLLHFPLAGRLPYFSSDITLVLLQSTFQHENIFFLAI